MTSATKGVPFEDRIAYMEAHINAFKWESCAKILVYLNIFGSLSSTALNDRLGFLGEKSLYRSINKLIKIGLVEKTRNTKDRRSVSYKLTGVTIKDPEFDEPFIQHLTSINKLSLISDYLAIANKSSSGFLNTVTEIMQERQKTDPHRFQERFLASSIFFEVILPIDNANQLRDKIDQFITDEILPYINNVEVETQKPIQNPAALYISFMPI